jgi:branched-chain amino acid transport system permease protein
VVRVGGFAIPMVRLSGLILAFAILAALHLFLAKARWGRAIRATAEDWEAAALMGIPVQRTYLLAFALGTALAGIAGGLVSVSYSISPAIGLEWTLKALIVIVLAGLGSLFGSLAGGILLGLAEGASVVFLGGPYREVVGLVLFLIILLVRPEGLFGRRG